MKKISILFATLFAIAGLSACAQQEEEIVIVEPEPVYDKYGNVVE